MSFLLDQKGPKNQGPTKICLSRLRNSGKKYFSSKFLIYSRDAKFQNGRFKNNIDRSVAAALRESDF